MQWFDSDAPESGAYPQPYESTMSEFQRLCLLRCFRADRIYRAVVLYVSKAMGDFFVQPPIISIDGVFDQSTPTTPVVFILSPGADPAGDLTKLADRSGTALLPRFFQHFLTYRKIIHVQ